MATVIREDLTHVGGSKIERYGWGMTGDRPVFRFISKDALSVGARYQREANHPKVLEIASEWNWIACGAISVAKVGDKFRVLDGQHRVLGARKRSDIDTLPCLVFEGMSFKEEARAFLALNTLRKPVSAIDKHNASVIAEDDVAVKINETLEALGVEIVRSPRGPGQFGAVAWAKKKVSENFGGFVEVMTFATEITREAGMPVAEKLIDGLWYIHQRVPGGITGNKRVGQRFKHVGAEKLLDGAIRAAALYARGGAKVFAEGILMAANKGAQYKIELS